MSKSLATTQNQTQNQTSDNLPQIAPPRLPYHPAIEERFGIDRASWKALVEAVFPQAQSTDSVILALSYCRARGIDPLKRVVHIVPVWDSQQRRLVDTVWPGIGELRTTAIRTGAYAGRAQTEFGPEIHEVWTYRDRKGQDHTVEVTFPEWAQVSVYRMVGGQRVEFAGPRVYWLETYARIGATEAPNAMWARRPRGQLDKCAEAAALRAAFPEELGDQFSSEEVGALAGRAALAPEQPHASEEHGTRSQVLASRMLRQTQGQQEQETEAASEALDTQYDQYEVTDESETRYISSRCGFGPWTHSSEGPSESDASAEADTGGEPSQADLLVDLLAQHAECDTLSASSALSKFVRTLLKTDLDRLDDDQAKAVRHHIVNGDINVEAAK